MRTSACLLLIALLAVSVSLSAAANATTPKPATPTEQPATPTAAKTDYDYDYYDYEDPIFDYINPEPVDGEWVAEDLFTSFTPQWFYDEDGLLINCYWAFAFTVFPESKDIKNKDILVDFHNDVAATLTMGMNDYFGTIFGGCRLANTTHTKKFITYDNKNHEVTKVKGDGVTVRYNCFAGLPSLYYDAISMLKHSNMSAVLGDSKWVGVQNSLRNSTFFANPTYFNARVSKNYPIKNESSNTLIGITVASLVLVFGAMLFSTSGSAASVRPSAGN